MSIVRDEVFRIEQLLKNIWMRRLLDDEKIKLFISDGYNSSLGKVVEDMGEGSLLGVFSSFDEAEDWMNKITPVLTSQGKTITEISIDPINNRWRAGG